jgi:hypothetical protein
VSKKLKLDNGSASPSVTRSLTLQQRQLLETLPNWTRKNNNLENNHGSGRNTPTLIPNKPLQPSLESLTTKSQPSKSFQQPFTKPSTHTSNHNNIQENNNSSPQEIDVSKLDVDSMMDATTYAGVDLKAIFF